MTSLAKVDNRATIWLTVVFKSSISPCTSTLTVRLKSPFATAFVTSEIERTWSVKFVAIFCAVSSVSLSTTTIMADELTLTFLVKSAQVPWTPSTRA